MHFLPFLFHAKPHSHSALAHSLATSLGLWGCIALEVWLPGMCEIYKNSMPMQPSEGVVRVCQGLRGTCFSGLKVRLRPQRLRDIPLVLGRVEDTER